MPFVAPGPRLPQKRPRTSKAATAAGTEEHACHAGNATLQRLRLKRDTGRINPVERQMLCMLEQQTATEVKLSLAAKAAIKAGAQQHDEAPMTSTQARARFLCRAKQAEIAKAKAATQYVPEGPPTEGDDQEASAVRKKQHFAQENDSQWQFWNSYFQKVPTAAARQALVYKQRQQQQAKQAASNRNDNGGDSQEEEDEHIEDEDDCRFYNDESSQGFSSPYDLSDSDSDRDAKCDVLQLSPLQHGVGAVQQAYMQLVSFVQQLPSAVCRNPAAARLKTFATLKVNNKQDLSAAARQIWLSVHPDKNRVGEAQVAAQNFGKLLDTMKAKGLL